MPGEIPIHIPEPTVEVIAERRKSKRKERFDRIPSGVEGVELIVEPGTEPHFTKRQVRKHQADSDRIARYRKTEKIFKGAKERLVEAAEKQDGFRGIVSHRGNYEAPLVPSDTKIVYDADLLEKSTGDHQATLVREEGRLEISLPIGSNENAREALSDFTQAVARVMIGMGRDPDAVGALIKPTIIQRLDEERLNKLIADGKIELLPGTRTSEISWSTPINPIDKSTKPNRQRSLTQET